MPSEHVNDCAAGMNSNGKRKKKSPMTDIINHPSHYAEGREHEPIDVIVDWDPGYLEGQVVKYLSRLGRKDDALQDARKAQFYMNRLVAELTPPPIDASKIVSGSVSFDKISATPHARAGQFD